MNHSFGGTEQLISAVIDRWFETLVGLAEAEGTPDERPAVVIDAAFR